MAVASPIFFTLRGGRAKRPSHTSQRSAAAAAVAAKMVAGRGDGGDGGEGCGSGGPWKSTVEAVVTVPRWACPRRASGESGRERAVASMVAHLEVVMAPAARWPVGLRTARFGLLRRPAL